VEQYVHASLLLLKHHKGLDLEKATLGIVGVGHVGKRVQRMAEALGMRVLLNDPPREDNGEKGFVSLQTIAEECDVITFHTPLNREGKYRTFHLADEAFFGNLKRTPYLINSSRGEVVSAEALLKALETGQIKDAVIDTWEGEPDISLELLRKVFVGTPHIAGYSADGKANATRMSLEALCLYFGKTAAFSIVPPDLPEKTYSENPEEAYLEVYNPMEDSLRLKESPEKFEWFRGNYPLRRELF
jgi:erythronate-4-phosphate dehydrogenase